MLIIFFKVALNYEIMALQTDTVYARYTKPTLDSYRQQIVRNDWDMQITNQLRLGQLLQGVDWKNDLS